MPCLRFDRAADAAVPLVRAEVVGYGMDGTRGLLLLLLLPAVCGCCCCSSLVGCRGRL